MNNYKYKFQKYELKINVMNGGTKTIKLHDINKKSNVFATFKYDDNEQLLFFSKLFSDDSDISTGDNINVDPDPGSVSGPVGRGGRAAGRQPVLADPGLHGGDRGAKRAVSDLEAGRPGPAADGALDRHFPAGPERRHPAGAVGHCLRTVQGTPRLRGGHG